jgi:hypothetical protein
MMRSSYTDPKTGRTYWHDNPEDVKALQELDPLGRRAAAQSSAPKESEVVSEVTKDDTNFIHCLYDYVLGRKPDPNGLKYWESYSPRSGLVAAFMAEAQKELANIK